MIIAGQNGSGKSCIFDAIRLIKSIYGGYQANEWQQWMGEFQISPSSKASELRSLFNDTEKELRISCSFRLSDAERSYIKEHQLELLTEMFWRLELPDAYAWGGYRFAMFAAQFRDREPAVRKRAFDTMPVLTAELAADDIKAECFIPVGGVLQLHTSFALSLIFSIYEPKNIGVIDYHGAQRHYGRENVQGINLNLDATTQQRSQAALYNYMAKYANVKSEMAGSFISDMLSEKSGAKVSSPQPLSETLKELFSTFFPDKEFLGPQPTADGRLLFPVKTADKHTHDLDELSSGEKEILYGYLRIRNSAPQNSIIIIDEPELHLNPRLVRGLPQFYRKNLGIALGNQIWLVTHSDALLREVVGREGYDVFHMMPSSIIDSGEHQLRRLKVTADIELALIDLVGDLASYRPGGKVVIFEGGGDADFDRQVVAALFPELQLHANLVSGSNKTRVQALHETLTAAATEGRLPFKFYAVVDRDSSNIQDLDGKVDVFSWDLYHIENYFLEPKYIALAIRVLSGGASPTEEQIIDSLRECARDTMPQLVRGNLVTWAHNQLYGSIRLGVNPASGDVSAELFAALSRASQKVAGQVDNDLSLERIREEERRQVERYESSLADGSWKSVFRGRDILKRFTTKNHLSVSYDIFRNVIKSKMQDDGFRPVGMASVVERILSDMPPQ